MKRCHHKSQYFFIFYDIYLFSPYPDQLFLMYNIVYFAIKLEMITTRRKKYIQNSVMIAKYLFPNCPYSGGLSN